MILVDSSVWIDFFRQTQNSHTIQLVKWMQGNEVEIAVADLVIFEVTRGFLLPKDQVRAKELLLSLTVVEIGGIDNALIAAEHYHALRQRGYPIRSPIDVLLASYCMTHDHTLLHRDADFDVMEILRGSKTWPH